MAEKKLWGEENNMAERNHEERKIVCRKKTMGREKYEGRKKIMGRGKYKGRKKSQ